MKSQGLNYEEILAMKYEGLYNLNLLLVVVFGTKYSKGVYSELVSSVDYPMSLPDEWDTYENSFSIPEESTSEVMEIFQWNDTGVDTLSRKTNLIIIFQEEFLSIDFDSICKSLANVSILELIEIDEDLIISDNVCFLQSALDKGRSKVYFWHFRKVPKQEMKLRNQ